MAHAYRKWRMQPRLLIQKQTQKWAVVPPMFCMAMFFWHVPNTATRSLMALLGCLQDVELYLTKESRESGFTLVARVGRMLQELLVNTSLTKDDMKKALTRVLSRVR